MKCIVLAGGRGGRLWPLSRKNYPKQFISLDGSHSIFQDTIARNMAYCDEFVVVTNREYQFIVENQLKAFQGLTWRLVLEEEARKTTAAILLACLEFPLSELIFIVPSDHLIQGERRNCLTSPPCSGKQTVCMGLRRNRPLTMRKPFMKNGF